MTIIYLLYENCLYGYIALNNNYIICYKFNNFNDNLSLIDYIYSTFIYCTFKSLCTEYYNKNSLQTKEFWVH